MTTTCRAIALSIVALQLPAVCIAHEESGLAATLRSVMASHVQAYDAEDVEGTRRAIHTKSPEYRQTTDALPRQFEALDLRAELVSFRLLGHDDEFAVARVKTKVVAPGDAAFQDNVVDSLTVFHQEDGTWKLWSDETLGIEFLAQ